MPYMWKNMNMLLFSGHQPGLGQSPEDYVRKRDGQSCLRDVAVFDEQFGYQDRPFGSPHLGVVRHQEILDAIWQDAISPESANRGGHAIFGIAVKPRLRPEWVFLYHYQVFWS